MSLQLMNTSFNENFINEYFIQWTYINNFLLAIILIYRNLFRQYVKIIHVLSILFSGVPYPLKRVDEP